MPTRLAVPIGSAFHPERGALAEQAHRCDRRHRDRGLRHVRVINPSRLEPLASTMAHGFAQTTPMIYSNIVLAMSMSRTMRFRLKSGLVDEMNRENSGWDRRRQNLLLSEFGFETMSGDWHDPTFEEAISSITDADLVEMFSIVTGIDREAVEDVVETTPSGNWKPGYVRLFMSHSAMHKKFIGEVADELAVVGIHAFVAHDSMEYSKPWQAQIEEALKSMQAFVAVIHPEFLGSPWCNQEVGWALGRRVPRYVIRMGADPKAFISHDQWPACHQETSKEVASIISTWASSVAELGETMTDGLFAALESAGNYIDAGATADRIASLSGLTEEQWARLSEIYWTNDQLFTGVLPSRALEPFYRRHGREWPPSKATPPVPPVDPWATSGNSGPVPF